VKFFGLLPGIQEVSYFTYSTLYLVLHEFLQLQSCFIVFLDLDKRYFLLCFSRNIQILLNSFIRFAPLAQFLYLHNKALKSAPINSIISIIQTYKCILFLHCYFFNFSLACLFFC
jgi:hypothetical protein